MYGRRRSRLYDGLEDPLPPTIRVVAAAPTAARRVSLPGSMTATLRAPSIHRSSGISGSPPPETPSSNARRLHFSFVEERHRRINDDFHFGFSSDNINRRSGTPPVRRQTYDVTRRGSRIPRPNSAYSAADSITAIPLIQSTPHHDSSGRHITFAANSIRQQSSSPPAAVVPNSHELLSALYASPYRVFEGRHFRQIRGGWVRRVLQCSFDQYAKDHCAECGNAWKKQTYGMRCEGGFHFMRKNGKLYEFIGEKFPFEEEEEVDEEEFSSG